MAAPGEIATERPWTARWLALRDALIALDGDQAGAFYREMKVLHFGEERVAAYWRTNSALKYKMRRGVACAALSCPQSGSLRSP